MKSRRDSAQPENIEPYNTENFPAINLKRIDDDCVQFEEEWQAGSKPYLKDYLTGFDGGLRSALLVELLLLDIEYRMRAGQWPDPSDYETRFPGDTPAIESAFNSAVDDSRRRTNGT